jgi:hypothetical protein
MSLSELKEAYLVVPKDSSSRIYANDLKLCSLSIRPCDGPSIPSLLERAPEYSNYLAGTTLYLGGTTDHYGHALIENVPRWWILFDKKVVSLIGELYSVGCSAQSTN